MSAFVCECLFDRGVFLCVHESWKETDFKSFYIWHGMGREHINQLDNSLMELTQQKKVLRVISDL